MAFSLTFMYLFHHMRRIILFYLDKYKISGSGTLNVLPSPNSSFCIGKVHRYDLNVTPIVGSSGEWPPRNLITDDFYLYFGPISKFIIVAGVIGNLVNLVVLSRPNLRSTTFTYLFWLAVSDIAYLILNSQSLLLYDFDSDLLRSCGYMYFFCRLSFVATNALYANSVFLVTFLAIDRHTAICSPLRGRPGGRPNYRRVYVRILGSILFATALYVPVAFQADVILQVTNLWDSSTAFSKGWTPTNLVLPDDAVPLERLDIYLCGITQLHNTRTFSVYVTVREIIAKVVPVAAVTVLNLRMMIALWKNSAARKNMTCTGEADRDAEDRRLTWLLTAIVLMQVICTTPQIISWCFIVRGFEIGGPFWIFDAVAEVMLSVNAAGNFYVYCLCSAAVRKELKRIFSLRAR